MKRIPSKDDRRKVIVRLTNTGLDLGRKAGSPSSSTSPGKASTRSKTGKYDPSLPLAFKIAATFDQPIEDIFEPD